MKQFKLTLVLTVLMSMVGLQAFAAWDTSTKVQVDGLYYYLDNDNLQAQVTYMPSGKYTGNIEIPLDFIYAGKIYSVTSIGSYAFYGCKGLTSVTIPNSVTEILHDAFTGCSGLTSITIPNSVTSTDIFSGCTGLSSIIVEPGNTEYDSRDNCNAIIETASNTLIAGCKNTTIPNSVTRIDAAAFYGCTGLTSITIPSSVTSIGYLAFSECSGLTSVTIPNSVTSIGEWAFENCSGLTSVTLNSNAIVSKAYTYSDNLKSIFGEQVKEYVIGDDVTAIGDNAFYGCTGLTSITIPNSVTSIGENAFRDCTGLTSIKVESGNTTYDSRDNCNALIETASNTLIVGCNNTIIPNSVTSIGAYAFNGYTGLTSITIPNSVTSIGENAFRDCTGLTSVTIGSGVTSIGGWAFYNTAWYNNQLDGLVYAGKVAYKYKGTMPANTVISILEGTLGIAGSAFEDCSGLTSVTIPNSVTSIGGLAFDGCSDLTSVTALNPTPVAITEYVFTNRTNATLYVPEGSKTAYQAADYWIQFKEIIEMTPANTNITFADANVKALCVANWDTNGNGELSEAEAAAVTDLGEVFKNNSTITSFNELRYFTGLTSIGNSAFENCSALTSVTIPNSVTSIGGGAFYNCSGLTSIIVELGNTIYDSRNNCNAIIETANNTLIAGCKDTTIPNSVTSIGWGAFYGCSGLTSITIPNSVTSIGSYAFSGCFGLTSVTIPNSVTSIGSSAFSGCSGLTSVTIPNSVTSIGSSAFYGCSGLTSVTIPNSVTSIRSSAFEDCSALTSVTIPNSVTSIGSSAFDDCSALTSITIPNSVTSIGRWAFERCSGLTSIIVASGNSKYDSRNNCNAIIETANNTLIAGCKNTTIPNSVTSIGNEAFRYCTGLTSVTIPNSVTSIGDYAFYYCSGLTFVTIPNSVTSIGNMAFNGCTGLTSVTIGNSVTSIGDRAFSWCSDLTYVKALNPTPVAIKEYVFTNRENATLYVPKGSESAYQAAAYWKEFKAIVEIDVTGIDQINFQENGEQGIDEEGAVWYTIDGKQVDKPKKGINIIRMSNGTTKKVVVK